jgi:putative transposase
MKDALLLLTYLLAKLARLLRPGGARTIAAENLLMRQQLVMIQRSRHRAPNLTTHDRILFGFWSLFLSPRRSARAAGIIQASTLLRFHDALKPLGWRLSMRKTRLWICSNWPVSCGSAGQKRWD